MKDKKVPESLRKWFFVHFIVDYLFGIPLLFFPRFILSLFNWPYFDPLLSRLVGAALIGIGSVSFIEQKSNFETYQSLLIFKIIWSASALTGILLMMIHGAPKAGWIFFAIFAVFNAVWMYYVKYFCR